MGRVGVGDAWNPAWTGEDALGGRRWTIGQGVDLTDAADLEQADVSGAEVRRHSLAVRPQGEDEVHGVNREEDEAQAS